jgi:hypothetical protein
MIRAARKQIFLSWNLGAVRPGNNRPGVRHHETIEEAERRGAPGVAEPRSGIE